MALMLVIYPTIVFAADNTCTHYTDEELAQLTYEIAFNIRCIVCNGENVAESRSEFSNTLKDWIKQMLVNCYTKEEIYNIVRDTFGEDAVVVTKPSVYIALLWLFPILFLALVISYTAKSFIAQNNF